MEDGELRRQGPRMATVRARPGMARLERARSIEVAHEIRQIRWRPFRIGAQWGVPRRSRAPVPRVPGVGTQELSLDRWNVSARSSPNAASCAQSNAARLYCWGGTLAFQAATRPPGSSARSVLTEATRNHAFPTADGFNCDHRKESHEPSARRPRN